jgi:hypothetical protein
MTHNPFDDVVPRRRGVRPIDNQSLLACIPDELSLGLTEEEIRKEYVERFSRVFHIKDFHEALLQLVGEQVRSTDRTLIDGTQVPHYRRA